MSNLVTPSVSEGPGGAGGAPRNVCRAARPPRPLAHARGDRVAIVLFLFATSATAQLTLDDAIRRAVANSPDVRAARAGRREAAANADLSRQLFRPSSSISTTPGYASGVPVAILGSVPAIATIEAHQTLVDNYAKSDALAADALIAAREADVDAAVRDVAGATAQAYATLASDAAIVDAAQRRAAAYEREVARTTALKNEGRATDLDVRRASLQVARAQLRIAEAQSVRGVDEQRLRALIGGSEPIVVAPFPSTDASPDAAAARSNDAMLKSLMLQEEKLRESVALLERPFQPMIALQTQYSRLFSFYGKYYRDFKVNDASIGASIVVPLWSGGRRAAGVERAQAQLERISALREQRERQIDADLRDAEADLVQARAERDLAGRAHVIAEEGLRVNQLLAQEGRGEANAVTLSEAEIADADEQLARAELHLSVAAAKLLNAEGKLAPH